MQSACQKKKSICEKFFDNCIFKSWWVIIFLLVTFVLHDRLIKEKQSEIFLIKDRLEKINAEKDFVALEKDELLMQLNSQSDPEWIELVLMKKLGVVPEGYYKIHFKKS